MLALLFLVVGKNFYIEKNVKKKNFFYFYFVIQLLFNKKIFLSLFFGIRKNFLNKNLIKQKKIFTIFELKLSPPSSPRLPLFQRLYFDF